MLGLIVSVSSLLWQAPAPAPTASASTPAAAPTPVSPSAATPASTPTAAPATPPSVGAAPAAKPATPAAKPPEPSLLTSILPLLPIVILGYFMMVRPTMTQEKKRREQLSRLQRNARVVTNGGILGTVVSVDDAAKTVILRIGSDPGLKVEFTKASIGQILDSPDKDKA